VPRIAPPSLPAAPDPIPHAARVGR
jgi:hypothetical protein